MSLRLVTPPAVTPVTLDEVKAHCRVDTSDDDTLLSAYLAAAVEQVEGTVQKRYITQTLELVLPCWRQTLRMPIAPVASIDFIKYADYSGAQQTLDPANYIVTPSGQTIEVYPKIGQCWPQLGAGLASEPVVVRFTAGADIANVPNLAKQAIKLVVGAWYENREAFVANQAIPYEIPFGVKNLLMAEAWD